MRRRCLLMHIHSLAGGGAEKVFARIASGFAQRGDRVLLVVDRRAEEWLSLVDPAVELIALPPGRARSALALARIIRREAPDFSISALGYSNLKLTIAAGMAGQLSRTILTYHGFFEQEPGLLSRLGYLFAPLLVRATAATVVVSNAMRDELIGRFRAPAKQVSTLYNPALPHDAPPPVTAHDLAAREPRVVAIGRLVPDKGYACLLRAFARIDDPRSTLTILGVGPELDALQRQARDLGLAERVEFPGFVLDTDSYLSSARCFALASSHETFSLALVEALSHGLPVVATRSGGPSEIVNSPSVGSLVAVGDEESLAAGISAALADPGDPAPRQARAADFTLDAALDAYDALMQRVASEARSLSGP